MYNNPVYIRPGPVYNEPLVNYGLTDRLIVSHHQHDHLTVQGRTNNKDFPMSQREEER